MLRMVCAVAAVAALGSCADDRWSGYVYPNRNDLTKHVTAGVYPTLEECRHAALDMLANLSARYTGDFECGLNCRAEPGMTVHICDRSER